MYLLMFVFKLLLLLIWRNKSINKQTETLNNTIQQILIDSVFRWQKVPFW
jgi:hypothetical protein